MRAAWAALTIVVLHATAATAADPGAEVQRSLEGMRVIVRLDLPAHMDGVDISAADGSQLDEPKYRRKLKTWGAAYRSGDTATITKVKVGSKQVQVLLGAGGYGSWKSLGMSDAVARSVATAREDVIRDRRREVEERDRDFKHGEETGTSDQQEAVGHERERLHAEREALQREGDREVFGKKLKATEAIALRYGSRLHVRFSGGLPASIASPAGLRQLLSSYLTFVPQASGAGSTPPDSFPTTEPR